jgi:L-gulonolactone oxidase
VGQTLLRQLVGYCRVKALFRTENDLSRAWRQKGCEIVLGNLADPACLRNFLADVDVVFHCAATMGKTDLAKSHEVNVLGTQALLAESATAGCQLFVHFSSISVYAATESPDRIYTEEIEPEKLDSLNPYSRTKLLSEHEVSRFCREHSLNYIILRPTNIYGPNSRPWLLNIMRLVQTLPLLVGDVELNLVHVDDIARAAVQAARTPSAFNQTFNLGHESKSLREYMAAIADHLHRRYVFLPRSVDRIVCRCIDKLYQTFTGTRMSFSFARPSYYPTAKARNLFGYEPQIHLEEGLRRTFYWLNETSQQARGKPSRRYIEKPGAFDALEQIRVRSESDLVAAVERAAEGGLSVRAVGSMGSKNGNFHTPGIVLDLSNYNRALSVSGDLVTVQAGMKMRDLYSFLNAHELALANVGEWSGATVGGACSAGTHGGSLRYGSMANLMDSMKVIMADGSVRLIRRDDPLFDYVGISFGLFGILSEVTLHCVPRFRLKLEKVIMRFEHFLANFERLNAEHEYWAAVWIPAAGHVLVYAADRTTQPSSGGRRDERYGFRNLTTCFIANRLGPNHFFKEKQFPRVVIGDWNEILSPIGVSGLSNWVNNHLRLPIEIEVAVPVNDANEVLLALRNLFEKEGRFPTAPVGLRCGSAESFKLSPCYQQDSLWICIFIMNDERLLTEVSTILAEHHCRFHWSKNISLPPEYIQAQYEAWEDIVRLKHELDPHSLFSNHFTRQFGL